MSHTLAAVQWDNGIENAWSSTVTFLPKFLGFLLILFVGWFVAKALATVTDRVLERLGFDRAVERGGIRQALARSRYDASDIVAKVVFYGLMLFVLQLAFGIFGANPVSDLIAGVVAFLPKLLAAILIVVVASAIAAAVKDIVGNALGGLSYGRALAAAASVSILVIGGFMALNQLQIAPAIVNGLFYGLLAIVVGSAIVAIGGSGIQPLRGRWERALQKIDEEAPRVRESVKNRPTVDLRTSGGLETGTVSAMDMTTEVPDMPTDPGTLAAAAAPVGPSASSTTGGTGGSRSTRRSTQDRIRDEIRHEQ